MSRFTLCLLFLALSTMSRLPAVAGLGTVLSARNVTVDTQDGTTVLTPSAAVAVLTVDALTLDAGEQLVVQGFPEDVLVLRVTGTAPARIEHSIEARCRLVLINPRGLHFGAGSQIQAEAFLATTQDIPDAAFSAGSLTPAGPPSAAGRIDSQGRIRVGGGNGTAGAHVALVGTSVVHDGRIELARAGRVTLAAASLAEFPFFSGGRLTRGADLRHGTAGTAQLLFSGRVHALSGGNLDLVAGVGRDLATRLSHALWATGIADVVNTDHGNGKITLDGGRWGLVEVGAYARLDAVGVDSAGIDVLGARVHVTGRARLNAAGQGNGGCVLLGGTTTPAQAALLGPHVHINTDGHNGTAGTLMLNAAVVRRGETAEGLYAAGTTVAAAKPRQTVPGQPAPQRTARLVTYHNHRMDAPRGRPTTLD